MAAAARVAPKDYFAPDEWAPLAKKSAWKGPALIAHAWLVILATGAATLAWPFLLPLAVMIIGARQLGLLGDREGDAAAVDDAGDEDPLAVEDHLSCLTGRAR